MISNRLSSIAKWIEGDTIADVGCDHAYLSLAAIQSGKSQKAYALDIAEGPLENAKKSIRKAGYQDQIIPVLSDGLKSLDEPVDQVVIAGMGGTLIASILEEGKSKIKENASLLLSPNTKDALLRSYLTSHGWRIEKEKKIVDGTHFYPLLFARKGSQVLNEREIRFGINIEEDDVYDLWLKEQVRKRNWILKANAEHPPVNIQKELSWLIEMNRKTSK